MGLDLSGIEAWTRELLDDVARKRGIRNPEFRRRGELVRLLLRQHYGLRLQAGRERVARGVQAAGQVRDLLGKLVSSAFEALPAPAVAKPEVSTPPNPPSAPAELRAKSAPTSGEPASALPVATTRTFLEGPARSRAVARALAASGHVERAMQVYAELIERARDDAALATEAAAVRRGDRPPAPLGASRQTPRRRGLQLPASDDHLSCEAGRGTAYSLHWQISEAGVRRARAVLGSDGTLTVRLISVEPDPDRVVHSSILEHGPVPRTGEWRTPALHPDHRCLAAVGLLAGGRFVAIVHARPGLQREPHGALAANAT